MTMGEPAEKSGTSAGISLSPSSAPLTKYLMAVGFAGLPSKTNWCRTASVERFTAA